MTNFSPKEHYLKHQTKLAAKFRDGHASEWFSVTLDYALAQLTWLGASKEELDGAKRYINLLMTIHEPDEKARGHYPPINLPSNEPPEEK